MNRAWTVAVVLGAAVAAAGCDFDRELRDCAEEEWCQILQDAPIPILRFPRNGAGLGSPSAYAVGDRHVYTPRRPYLIWDTDSAAKWVYRIQLNRCDPGTSLSQCPFPREKSDTAPDNTDGYYVPTQNLDIGRRYWWRVRACDSTLLGRPCGPWSTPHYFDVGRPEAMPNDFDDSGHGDLAIAESHAGNGSGGVERVFLYQGGGAGPTVGGWIQVQGPLSSGDYTVLAAGTGDLNGDGSSDLAVTYAPVSSGATFNSRIDVFLGGLSGISVSPNAVLTAGGANLGGAMGRAGDINGDGLSDLLVVQPVLDRAIVFAGRPGSGTADSADGDIQLPMDVPVSGSMAFAAPLDMDADGYDEVVVAGGGEVRIFRGRPGGGPWDGPLLPRPGGGSVALHPEVAAGDFNGDGHGDVVAVDVNRKALLFLGSPSFFFGAVQPPIPFDVPTTDIVSGGDVNNDGYADLVVRAGSGPGGAQVFFGRASGPPEPGPVLPGTSPFGTLYAGVGDVTDDGYTDVSVVTDQGVTIYRGAPSESDIGSSIYTVPVPNGSAQFGISVAGGY